MKKQYQKPAIEVVKLQQKNPLLTGSPDYKVNPYNAGGEETVGDDNDW